MKLFNSSWINAYYFFYEKKTLFSFNIKSKSIVSLIGHRFNIFAIFADLISQTIQQQQPTKPLEREDKPK